MELSLPMPGAAVYKFKESLSQAEFLERPNRFLSLVRQGERVRQCHLHDPGRLEELTPGSVVLVREVMGIKTSCSVVAFMSSAGWVPVDSRIHSEVASLFLPGARREVSIGKSRLDFAYEGGYVEVKGCTLVRDGRGLFPDSPTRRGRKHLEELIRIRQSGQEAGLLFLVLREDATCLAPNEGTDPLFAAALQVALLAGVQVWALKFAFRPPSLVYLKRIPLCANRPLCDHRQSKT
ncbi:MAG: DNA/RNA nuclease SfsA [Thermoprotei archaeon]